MSEIAKTLLFAGILLTISGLILWGLSSLTGLPKMPGDIFIKKGNVIFYFPWVTSIIVSIILTILINLFLRK